MKLALARLAADGHQAWLVGGSVRDVLLGRSPAPAKPVRWDVASDRAPDEVRAVFPRVEGVGERHGTVLVLWEGLELEVTTFRREGEYGDARRPDQVWFTRDVLEDLARRDLTVNALAYSIADGRLLDPYGGARDVLRRTLRAVGDPLERFREDALRPLRVARFAAVLEMDPEEETRAALAGVSDRIGALAVERVLAELERLMGAPRPSRGFEILREAGLLARWLPELAACRGVPQNRFHAYDVYFHSLYSCDAASPEKPEVRWAALLHDIGKPGTRVERAGEGTFHGHEELGARLADARLAALRFPNESRARIVHLIREHMFDFQTTWSDAAVRRFIRRVGVENVADLFDLRLADALGNGTRGPDTRRLEAMAKRIERVLREASALSVHQLAVDGDDVMRALGLPPGPEVGRVLTTLLEQVIEQPALNTRPALLQRLDGMRSGRGIA
ncbi:MAG TPA: HD domain-containing protein [Methylomirabilota bacterium]|nr:HD domain-containing protein [Methylomirabilota bacterium]